MVEGYTGYSPEEEQEIYEEDQIEEGIEKQQEAYDNIDTTPSFASKDDLYSLFKWVISRENSSKIGNIDKTELGMLNISVRDCQKIALLADTLNHTGFADFFRFQSEIILSTSLSKKGHLIDLFVTTQKKSSKSRELPQMSDQVQPAKKKRRIF